MYAPAIFVICTCSARGRYVRTASTSRPRAEKEAARIVEGLALEGWTLEAKQTPAPGDPDGEAAGVPAVVEVSHLKNPAGEWLNVELLLIYQ